MHYDTTPNDYGIHLLMSPYKELLSKTALGLKGLSVHVLVTMLDFLFSFKSVTRIIAEPDSENKAANCLAQNACYRFMKEIQLSYKTANLYSYDREDFLKAYC
jgi:RimJ/RimL family protein N-acetyltransferase